MAKLRDFLSLEQALIHASKDLTDEELKKIGKKKDKRGEGRTNKEGTNL